MHRHAAPHLTTGPAVLGALLALAAISATVLLFRRAHHGKKRRILVTVNFVGITIGLLLLQHNYRHLQALVVIGFVFGIMGIAGLVGLLNKAWPEHPEKPTKLKRYRLQRSELIGCATLAFSGLVISTAVFATTPLTWHWT